MLNSIARYLSWRRFASTVSDVSIKEGELEELRGYRSSHLEEKLYDACKKKLFSRFADGEASKDYAKGFMDALSYHRGMSMKQK